MIGAIIGDIVGSRFEFANNTTDRNFELFTKDSSYTDDTICTIAIADAINRRAFCKTGDPCYGANLLRWCRRYSNPMGGYGGSFACWIHSAKPEPYNSFGNGSAMRVSPVAWAFNTLEEVKREAKRTASVTHNHPEGIKGAQAVAYAIWFLRQTKNIQAFKRNMDAIYPGFYEKEYPVGVFDETCQGTVPLACKIICQASNFEDAIRRAILQGGDSDTLGAITGSIAEAVWGVPSEIINFAMCFLPDEMKDVVYRFYDAVKNNLDEY